MKHPIQHPTKQTLEQQLENPQTRKSQPNETKAVDTTGESTEPGSAEEESFPEKKSSATYASLLVEPFVWYFYGGILVQLGPFPGALPSNLLVLLKPNGI